MKRVCLLNPDASGLLDKYSYPPLGLLYIASVLEKHGVDVSYVDFCIDNYQKVPDADIYGIAVHSIAVYREAKRIADRIRKDKGDGVLIVAGGAAVTSYFEDILKTGLFDVAVLGEGEETFLDIVIEKDIKTIKGIAYIENDRITVTPNRPYIKDIDTIPSPARHLIPKEVLQRSSDIHGRESVRSTTILTSRGCPYACAFCDTSQWGRKFRTRSPENVVSEIKDIQNNYNIHHVRFIDDIYTLDKDRVMEISKLLIPLNITYIIITRADCLDIDLIKMLKESGCVEILLGIETGSEKLLGHMNKKESLEDYKEAVRMMRQVGIASKFLLLFGFPGEDESTIADTVMFLEDSQPDKVHLSSYIPLPGSDVWNNPANYGISLNYEDVKRKLEEFWFYWEPNDDKGFIIELPNMEGLKRLRRFMINYVRREAWKIENSAIGYWEKSRTELFASELG